MGNIPKELQGRENTDAYGNKTFTLSWKKNYNNKLYCRFFTDLRITTELIRGDKCKIKLNNKFLGQALVKEKTTYPFKLIPDWLLTTATGLPLMDAFEYLFIQANDLPPGIEFLTVDCLLFESLYYFQEDYPG